MHSLEATTSKYSDGCLYVCGQTFHCDCVIGTRVAGISMKADLDGRIFP